MTVSTYLFDILWARITRFREVTLALNAVSLRIKFPPWTIAALEQWWLLVWLTIYIQRLTLKIAYPNPWRLTVGETNATNHPTVPTMSGTTDLEIDIPTTVFLIAVHIHVPPEAQGSFDNDLQCIGTRIRLRKAFWNGAEVLVVAYQLFDNPTEVRCWACRVTDRARMTSLNSWIWCRR
jgi:hypothetical protein